MKRRSAPVLFLLGWLFLLQLVGELTGLAVLFLTFDLFGGGQEMLSYGLFMLPLWALWGCLTPRPARSGGGKAAAALISGAAVLGALITLLPDYSMLLTLPQFCAGSGLAQLLPVHRGSALYFRVLPALQAASSLLMNALFALGLFLRRHWQPET